MRSLTERVPPPASESQGPPPAPLARTLTGPARPANRTPAPRTPRLARLRPHARTAQVFAPLIPPGAATAPVTGTCGGRGNHHQILRDAGGARARLAAPRPASTRVDPGAADEPGAASESARGRVTRALYSARAPRVRAGRRGGRRLRHTVQVCASAEQRAQPGA